jgi:23S rRNA pseudouridine1911/1915/1917 synthase
VPVTPRGLPVQPTWVVDRGSVGTRLDKFLAAPGRLGSRARAAAALERGKIFLNTTEASIALASYRLALGDELRLWTDRPGSAKARPRIGQFGSLEIVYEDDALLVVNKPPGLLSVPLERNPGVPSIYDLIRERFRSHGKQRPLVVHRIDQDTSGLVVFAKNAPAQAALREQFKRRQPERVYLAVVHGRPDPSAGTWRDHLVWDGKALIQKPTRAGDPHGIEAISEYRVVERLRGAALLEIRLRTGRRNQIRIQAALHGHPLVGERRYVYGGLPPRSIRFPRYALHASRLVFRHPDDGRPMQVDASSPADLVELIARLR